MIVIFIDTHCHLSSSYYEDIYQIILENRKNHVEKIIISGCEIDSIKESIDYAMQYEDVYLSLGYHPSEVDKITAKDLEQLEIFLQNKKVVAIGEIGLDYYYGKENKEKQQKLFEAQLQLAQKLNLPVIIHSREAVQDTMDILKKYSVKGIIHCFSGSLEVALQYIQMGYLLGIGGVITFKNSKLPLVVSKLKLTSLVLETDSPYLTPDPYRGKQNSSKYIPIIAEKIASIKEIPVEEVMKITTSNAERLFDFS